MILFLLFYFCQPPDPYLTSYEISLPILLQVLYAQSTLIFSFILPLRYAPFLVSHILDNGYDLTGHSSKNLSNHCGGILGSC